MGVARKSPDFVTDRCPCGKTFKGQNGRHEFYLHSVKCEHQIAIRIGEGRQ